jgi:hypothetical protein
MKQLKIIKNKQIVTEPRVGLSETNETCSLGTVENKDLAQRSKETAWWAGGTLQHVVPNTGSIQAP